MRRALLLCLVGAGLALLSSSRAWSNRIVDHGPSLPLERISLTGDTLAPGLRPLALVGLAAVLALLATRGWARRVIGLLVLGSGVGIGYLALAERPTASTGWSWVALAGGVVLAGGGVLTFLKGHRWGGLSDAYRTPAARADSAPVTDKGVWDALDRGEDPTADPHG